MFEDINLPISGLKISEKIAGFLPEDFRVGIFGTFFGKVDLYCTIYSLHVNEKVVTQSSQPLKTREEITGDDEGRVIPPSNLYAYDKNREMITATYITLEASGGILHRVNIEATSLKNDKRTSITYRIPFKNIVVKGILRSAQTTSASKDEKTDIHTLSGIYFGRVTVYLVDNLGYSVYNPPTKDDIKKILTEKYKIGEAEYSCCSAPISLKYTL